MATFLFWCHRHQNHNIMRNSHRLNTWLVLALIATLSLSSCAKYEEGPDFSLRSKSNRLSGHWEVVSIDGYSLASDGSIVLIEMKRNGNFSMLSSFNDGYGNFSNYRDVGEWEWENRKEEVEIEGFNFREDWEIIRLTNRALWFETSNRSLWKCVKN
jgi:hypothetical protein